MRGLKLIKSTKVFFLFIASVNSIQIQDYDKQMFKTHFSMRLRPENIDVV